ncbi:zinc finger C-x8-C-x5-C-x3-H type family protein [Actinidia rufa]|uniref:Zinc finger C-x8-C-x5-C-x3-H type family protein n=1 Tax=Actinidia rufa TaxID=165716 RepID=A0A7J0DV65_9ERIC|nr:zinc finger C-x8-C-x5-C-x3-H type family protein [Actinidia rufa]
MMIGERNHNFNPTVHVPPWPLLDDPTVDASFPYHNGNTDDFSPDALTALHRNQPSNDSDSDSEESDHPVDAYSCDHFRMYEFKVRMCTRGRSHDWTDCPYAHPGEKARRRDPRKYHYSAVQGRDPLPPARVLLRALAGATPGPEPKNSGFRFAAVRVAASFPDDELAESVVGFELGQRNGGFSATVTAEQGQVHALFLGLSDRWFWVRITNTLAMTRPGFCSLPSTPTRAVTRPGIGPQLMVEPVMERVESGRDLRAKMFEKLSRENPLDLGEPKPPSPGPDLGWVSELVK